MVILCALHLCIGPPHCTHVCRNPGTQSREGMKAALGAALAGVVGYVLQVRPPHPCLLCSYQSTQVCAVPTSHWPPPVFASSHRLGAPSISKAGWVPPPHHTALVPAAAPSLWLESATSQCSLGVASSGAYPHTHCHSCRAPFHTHIRSCSAPIRTHCQNCCAPFLPSWHQALHDPPALSPHTPRSATLVAMIQLALLPCGLLLWRP